MNSQVDRAVALLFPEGGRRTLDVKFFCGTNATAEGLAEQTIVCLAGRDDESNTIVNLDHGLTA